MSNKNLSNFNKKIPIIGIIFFVFFSATFVSAEDWISLNGTGEVRVNDANNLDGFSKATWNMWINQSVYNTNAGIAGKYSANTGARAYLIRTSLINGSSVSVALSGDGMNVGSYTSESVRACGVRVNNQWTMITVTYDGSLITYYRNGVKCDTDTTTIPSIYNSTSPLRLGGGNSVFFNGGIDEFTFYNQTLSPEQINRLFNESVYGTNLGDSVPVLVYHEIRTPASDPIFVTPENFSVQMKYLHDNGFTTVTLRDYLNWKNGTFNMPKKSIILVFDDGFETVYQNAKPIMDQYGFVGTIASVTRYASFTGNNTGYMKWSEIKTLSDSGWDIESHSITHSHMLTLNESQFRFELLNSRDTIANKTGKTPKSFVFPFHESNSTYTQICGEYYDLCWTQGSTSPTYDFISTNGKTYLGLRRINVANETTMNDFTNFLARDTNEFGEWTMDEGSGSTTADTSGHSNTGYLLGGAFWSNQNNKLMLMSSPLQLIITQLTHNLAAINNDNNNYNNKKIKDNNNSKENKTLIDGLDNVVDSDNGKSALQASEAKFSKEKKPWKNNEDIESHYYSTRKNLTDPRFFNKFNSF